MITNHVLFQTEHRPDFFLPRGGAADLAQPPHLLGRAGAEHRRELHVHLRLPLDARPVHGRGSGAAGNDLLLLHGDQLILHQP